MQSEYIYYDSSTYFQMNHSEEASQDNPDLEENPRGQILSMNGRKYCNRTVILSKKPLHHLSIKCIFINMFRISHEHRL